MTGAGIWGFFSTWAARTVLRWTSLVTLLDSLIGFFFHVRGIARKPGGWRLPVTNIVMGPPIFAPLLFGVSAYLGLIASFLRPEEAPPIIDITPGVARGFCARLFGTRRTLGLEHGSARGPFPEASRGRHDPERVLQRLRGALLALQKQFQVQGAVVAHHHRAAAHAGRGAVDQESARMARTVLPVMSVLAIVDGGVGFYYHARGVLRRPGGMKKPLYNIMYGPPIFAPLLFAACGVLGLLACLMRRERR